MRIVLFCHSLLSDWNHGNAHFLRGIVSELTERGHDVHVFEPADAWSVENLVRDHGADALELARTAYPTLRCRRYHLESFDLDEALDGADLVLVHEWTDPDLVRRIGTKRGATLLFHDTHHRSVTDSEAMSRYDLSGYDGVLAFGAALQDVYERHGWSRRSWVWHEAADVRVFTPRTARRDGDVVWIGNWGDDERTAELDTFLFEPIRDLNLVATVHGVRYPDHALRTLANHRITYGGWVPNFRVPDVFARYAFTVHVPRRPYVAALPGIPTIRVFEALACGIPLISVWWNDLEGLFRPGSDYLVARNGASMRAHMRLLRADPAARDELARRGRETILARHTCAHRTSELLAIVQRLRTGVAA
jgi:spore maturation protein CgeB